jgi:hypothetical protein
MKMKRVNIYAAVLGFAFLAVTAPVAVADERLFFIGNSYSQFHNGLDWIVKNLMEEASPNAVIETGRSFSNGASLSRHLGNIDGTNGDTALRQALITGDNTSWDLVVLQDQSTIPAFIFSDLWYQSRDAGVELHNLIEPTGAAMMFLETWGRQGALDDFFTDYTTMQRYLTKGMREYQKAANSPESSPPRSFVAPAGLAFQLVYDDTIAAGGTYESSPFADLYMPSDGSHPSWEGSYLTSLVIYAAYTGLSVADLEWVPGGISPERRDYLKSKADQAVFEDDTFYPSLAQERAFPTTPKIKYTPSPARAPTPTYSILNGNPSILGGNPVTTSYYASPSAAPSPMMSLNQNGDPVNQNGDPVISVQNGDSVNSAAESSAPRTAGTVMVTLLSAAIGWIIAM